MEHQNRCIHTAVNLEFIKNLTGEPEKNKSKYQSHCNTIMKFPDILSSIPEVRDKAMIGEDNIGIK